MALVYKAGDTFSVTYQHNNGSGTGVDLSGITVSAAVKRNTFYQALTVAEIDAMVGKFSLSATSGETALWPVGTLSCDVKYEAGDTVVRSETFPIIVNEGVTL